MGDHEVTKYKKGELIFEEGSKDPILYELQYGCVGIVKAYDTDAEVQLAEIQEGFFGENGLVDGAVRNASAVALEDCGVIKLDADAIKDFFVENPMKLEVLLQDLSKRIRTEDRDFIRACELIDSFLAVEDEGKAQDPALIDEMKQLLSGK